MQSHGWQSRPHAASDRRARRQRPHAASHRGRCALRRSHGRQRQHDPRAAEAHLGCGPRQTKHGAHMPPVAIRVSSGMTTSVPTSPRPTLHATRLRSATAAGRRSARRAPGRRRARGEIMAAAGEVRFSHQQPGRSGQVQFASGAPPKPLLLLVNPRKTQCWGSGANMRCSLLHCGGCGLYIHRFEKRGGAGDAPPTRWRGTLCWQRSAEAAHIV